MALSLATGPTKSNRAAANEPNNLAELEQQGVLIEQQIAREKAKLVHADRLQRIQRIAVLQKEIGEGVEEEKRAEADFKAADESRDRARRALVTIQGARFARVQPRTAEIGQHQQFIRAHAPRVISTAMAEMQEKRLSVERLRKVDSSGDYKRSNIAAIMKYQERCMEAYLKLTELLDAPLDAEAAEKAVRKIVAIVSAFTDFKLEVVR